MTQAPEWRSSWTEFVKELRTHFRPTNPIGTVEAELRHLTMASGACLSEYLVRFNTLASRVEWGDVALCFQFYDGLPDRLKDRIALLGKPDNLRELVQVTTHHDNLYWERQEEHKRARQQQPPQNTTKTPMEMSTSEEPTGPAEPSQLNDYATHHVQCSRWVAHETAVLAPWPYTPPHYPPIHFSSPSLPPPSTTHSDCSAHC